MAPMNLSIWPDRSWWLTPSGDHHEKPYGLLNYIFAPVVAHPIQGMLTALAVLPFGLRGFELWWACVLWAIVWQLFNVERLTLVVYPLYNLIWRPILAIVPVGVLIWVLG